MSHIALTYHIVFGTYMRVKSIDTDHERELYKFINDLSRSHGCIIRRIGGMPDHVHILCDIPAAISVAEYVKLIKTESSKFLRVNPHFPTWRRWAEGYAAFTVDASLRETRVEYIKNQKEHHRGVSFSEEYDDMLAKAGIKNTPSTPPLE